MTVLYKVTPSCVAPPPPPLNGFVCRFLAASFPACRRRRLLLARGTITLTGVIYLPIISHSRHAQLPRSVTAAASASSPPPLPFPPNFSFPLLILLNLIPAVHPWQAPLPSPCKSPSRRADEQRLGGWGGGTQPLRQRRGCTRSGDKIKKEEETNNRSCQDFLLY